jgi:transketolase
VSADARAVDLIRVLAMDAVEQAGSGHPGTAMSLAPAAYLLYQKILRHDPADPLLSGYGLTLDDIAHYRVWGSPLGQGIGNAVGMATAARRERGLLDPDAEPGTSPFDQHMPQH